MNSAAQNEMLIEPDDLILVTGASGFIGKRVVQRLIDTGFRNVRCLVRPSSKSKLSGLLSIGNAGEVEIVRGNLLSREDCVAIARDAKAVIHLAAGRGEKSFPDAFMNSAVTTRNLLEACVQHGVCRRFVNVSSFAVYDNGHKATGRLLDESCPLEAHPEVRGEAYCFAKTKQEQVVASFRDRFGLSVITLRPGVVYGPGNEKISGRVGIGTFGVFLHLGGSNPIPFTYVDNCAEAVVLAGLKAGVNGDVFNVVDDDVLSSREYLKLHKRNVRRFRSIYLPHSASYLLCYLWEKYSAWSEGQLPPIYGRGTWHAFWKKTRYSNQKLKHRLGWEPRVPTMEALDRFFESCRKRSRHA